MPVTTVGCDVPYPCIRRLAGRQKPTRKVPIGFGRPGRAGPDGETSGLLAPTDYLELHRETGVPMRAIWNLTQRWAQYGNPTGRIDAAAAQVGDDE